MFGPSSVIFQSVGETLCRGIIYASFQPSALAAHDSAIGDDSKELVTSSIDKFTSDKADVARLDDVDGKIAGAPDVADDAVRTDEASSNGCCTDWCEFQSDQVDHVSGLGGEAIEAAQALTRCSVSLQKSRNRL